MKSKRPRHVWPAISLVLLILLGHPFRLMAQLASIVGEVSDPSSAAIAGATVHATNSGTGLQWTAKTRAQGASSFELLPPGTYVVEASAAGFTPSRAANIQLVVNATSRVDLRLVLASLRENVQVAAQAPLAETETSEQGLVVSEAMIHDLPLNGRDFLQLAKLAPGVTGATDNVAS
jgi:hypothetical protein